MRLHYPLNANGAEDAGKLPWLDGVPSTGVEGSYPGHAIVTDTEAEILTAIDAAGLVRSGDDLSQLIQAIARGIWLGQFGGTSTALTAAVPNGAVIPSLQGGMRVRGIAASNYPGGGGTLAVTGIGKAGTTVSYPIVGFDGVTALASGAWVAGQFLTFDIDASGTARFGGSGGASSSGSLAGLTPTQRFQAIQASGSYTILSSAVKVFAVGPGGGGNTSLGGGAGGSLIGYLTGLTVGRTLAVAIGAAGAGSTSSTGGSNAGDTVVSSGSQTISALSATGGKAPVAGSGNAGFGGTATGGQINMQGNGGSSGIGGIAQPFAPYGNGGSTAMNGIVVNGTTIANQNGAQGIVVFEAVA